MTVKGSQHLPDQLDLMRAYVCERSKDDLLISSKEFVEPLNSLLFLFSCLNASSH